MMETAIAKISGQPVAKYDGKFVCSSMDPSTEAAAWVKKNQDECASAVHILVLGAGCGYHLVNLAKQFPEKSIIVFDKNAELIEFCKTQHSLDLLNIHWVHVAKVSELKSTPALRAALGGHYALLKFGPVTQLSASFYLELQEFLSGRSPEGLQFVVSQRPLLNGVFQPELFQPLRPAEARLLSIKDLKSNLKEADESYASHLISVLRELIA